MKLLGWIGDEVGINQAYLLFAASQVTDDRPAVVRHFLAAYRKAAHDYHDAFTGENEKRQDGPTAPAILDILAQYLGQPVELVRRGIPYFDSDARLDVKDVRRQIAWYRAQGLIKSDVSADALIDMRYAIALPEH